MYLYQKKKRYFAQMAGGLEELAADELIRLGGKNIAQGFRGAYFEADPAVLYRINYAARMISRVLAPLNTFACRGRNDLYSGARDIDWCRFFSFEQTFAVFANVADSQINHSQFAALCVKDAVVDSFRDRFGRRPNVDSKNPDLWINLHLMKDRATISLDTSGGPLHKRGYRKQGVTAPMQETLAAAIIELTQWKGEKPLYDPMCGSGTLLCEALIKYCRLPANLERRRFGFEHLPDFEPFIWDQVRKEVNREQLLLPKGLIGGGDKDQRAVDAARKNCRILPYGDAVHIVTQNIQQIESLENKVIVCNPPYGIRLGEKKGLADFYRRLGDFFKRHCKGAEAYVYFGEREWLKHIGLRPAWKKALRNGGLDGRLAKYEMY